VRTVDYTTATPTVTVTCDADPAKNNWNLGTGSDAPPPGVVTEGYGAEARWNLNDLYNQGLLVAGHNYRFYVIVHDGDQNKSGGDCGQASFNYVYPGPPAPPPSSISGFVWVDVGGPSGTGLPDGIFNGADYGMANVLVRVTGTDYLGHTVSLSTSTDATGSYSFTNLLAGTYTITKDLVPSFTDELSSVGTVNGTTNGTNPSPNVISQVILAFGDNGINYNFAEVLSGS
jgi:hypothetical protein